MTEKKPSSQPQVFRVELSQEQAILSVCSLLAKTASNGGGQRCRAGGNFCKNASAAGSSDSGARAS